MKTLEVMLRRVSRNNTRNCFALKCDIRKFFDSVDHQILLATLAKRIKDTRTMSLLTGIVGSFTSQAAQERVLSVSGLPIGNLTSQLFANIYLSGFDEFVKQILKVKNYVRYTDDFVIVSEDEGYLEYLIEPMSKFLKESLNLSPHPQKLSIRKYRQGIDFLGYVVLPYHIAIRTKTKRRIVRKLNKENLPSYLGVLSHANSFKLSSYLKEMVSDKIKGDRKKDEFVRYPI